MRASTGDTPPVDMAICTGSRSIIDGMIKLHSPGLSTTFTGILRALAW